MQVDKAEIEMYKHLNGFFVLFPKLTRDFIEDDIWQIMEGNAEIEAYHKRAKETFPVAEEKEVKLNYTPLAADPYVVFHRQNRQTDRDKDERAEFVWRPRGCSNRDNELIV